MAQPGASGGLAGALNTDREKSENQLQKTASHTEIRTLPIRKRAEQMSAALGPST